MTPVTHRHSQDRLPPLVHTLSLSFHLYAPTHTRIVVLHTTSIAERIAGPVDLPSCSAYGRPRGCRFGSGGNPSFWHKVLRCHAQHGECTLIPTRFSTFILTTPLPTAVLHARPDTPTTHKGFFTVPCKSDWSHIPDASPTSPDGA